jgi:hypothetical protein
MNTDTIKNFLGIAQSATSQLEQQRRLIADKNAEILSVEQRSITAEEAKAESCQQVNGLAAYHRQKLVIGATDVSQLNFTPSGSPRAPIALSPTDVLAFFAGAMPTR